MIKSLYSAASLAVILAVFIITVVASTTCSLADEVPNYAVVAITSPKNGEVLTEGKVQISVAFRAPDSQPVSAVKVYLDGKFITERTYDKPLTVGTTAFVWDTTRSPKGTHRLDVQIFSGNAYLAMATCVVTTADNASSTGGRDIEPPDVSIVGLSEGQVVSGKLRIDIEASDNSGKPPYVSVIIDNMVKSIRNFPPYGFEWDTSQEDDGPHTIKIVAMDDLENRRETRPLRVIVRNAVIGSPIAAAKTNVASRRSSTSGTNDRGRGSGGAPGTKAQAPIVNVRTEPVVKVSSTIEEYRRTVRAPSEVALEGLEIRQASAPLAAVPKTEVQVQDDAKASVPSVSEDTSSTAFDDLTRDDGLSGSRGESTSLTEEATGQADAVPYTSLAPISLVPVMATGTGSFSESTYPRFRGDLRLANPDAGKVRVTIVEKPGDDYVVQAGDTISAIAKKFKISASDLIRLNNIQNPDLIKAGDKLRLPSRRTTGDPKSYSSKSARSNH